MAIFDSVYCDLLTGPTYRRPYRIHTNAAATSPISRVFKPKLDLHRSTEKNIITATVELPGIQKEDVQLSVLNNVLTVSAENKVSSEHEEGGYVILERQHGKLSRSLSLPPGIKEEDITASMSDGVLTITFPGSSPEQEPRRIPVV